MKKKKKVIGNLSNKLFYTLIVIGVLIFGGVGVYALYTVAPTPGSTPNPGHTLAEIAPPESCMDGGYLKYEYYAGGSGGSAGYKWRCDIPSTGGGESLPTCSNGQILIKTSSGWTCGPICGSGQVLKKIPTSAEWACSDFELPPMRTRGSITSSGYGNLNYPPLSSGDVCKVYFSSGIPDSYSGEFTFFQGIGDDIFVKATHQSGGITLQSSPYGDTGHSIGYHLDNYQSGYPVDYFIECYPAA